MPKFVNGSSGHIYSQGKLAKEEDEDELANLTRQTNDRSPPLKKPSAVNKKGDKEQQKSSLDLFREELGRDKQRNNLRIWNGMDIRGYDLKLVSAR